MKQYIVALIYCSIRAVKQHTTILAELRQCPDLNNADVKAADCGLLRMVNRSFIYSNFKTTLYLSINSVSHMSYTEAVTLKVWMHYAFRIYLHIQRIFTIYI